MNRFLVKWVTVLALVLAESSTCTSESCFSSLDTVEAESVTGAALLAAATRKARIKLVEKHEDKPDKKEDRKDAATKDVSKEASKDVKKKDKNYEETKEGPIPGANDKNGPKAIGPAGKVNFLEWSLVGATIAVAGFPLIVFAYYLWNPGDKDSSREAILEHGGPISFAVQRTASKLYRAGRVVFRVGMFVVYFWFGILKVLGVSPAEPLVQMVFRSMPFLHVTSAQFFCKYVVGLGECIMAVAFILTLAPVPAVRFWSTAISITLGMAHLIMCSVLPMILLRGKVWQPGGFPWALTFEGQYIMKNIVLLSGFMLMGNDLSHPEDRMRLRRV